MRTRTKLGALLAATGLAVTLGMPAVASAAPLVANDAPVQMLGPCNYSGDHYTLRYDPNTYRSAVEHAQCLWNQRASIIDRSISEDGYFGPETLSAIYDIQEACGIDVDGIVGPDTWGCLHADQTPNPVWR